MIENLYRLVERLDGRWMLQEKWTEEYFRELHPHSSRYEDVVGWNWIASGSYKDMKELADKKIAEEAFDPIILEPPFPAKNPSKIKHIWWKFW